jgi:hypothetical protein
MGPNRSITEYNVEFQQALIDLAGHVTDEQVKIEKHRAGFQHNLRQLCRTAPSNIPSCSRIQAKQNKHKKLGTNSFFKQVAPAPHGQALPPPLQRCASVFCASVFCVSVSCTLCASCARCALFASCASASLRCLRLCVPAPLRCLRPCPSVLSAPVASCLIQSRLAQPIRHCTCFWAHNKPGPRVNI